MKAPASIVGLLIVGLGVGFWAGRFYYPRQVASAHEAIQPTEDGEIRRYRVALGIDPASKASLAELTNKELRSKALTTASNLRDLCFQLQKKNEELEAKSSSDAIGEQAESEAHLALDKQMSSEFITKYRSDAFNVDNELRRRLGPQALSGILEVSPSLVADDGTRIDVSTVAIGPASPAFGVEFTCNLADGIDQMADLLPKDSQSN
ncbi:MAG TPA: hypothetical protein VMB26_08965 [Candidatus Binataceae bacterium]|nr:hypothetical protein [Candidatus Binataceae bacterium]